MVSGVKSTPEDKDLRLVSTVSVTLMVWIVSEGSSIQVERRPVSILGLIS